jgi:hypothetical protein
VFFFFPTSKIHIQHFHERFLLDCWREIRYERFFSCSSGFISVVSRLRPSVTQRLYIQEKSAQQPSKTTRGHKHEPTLASVSCVCQQYLHNALLTSALFVGGNNRYYTRLPLPIHPIAHFTTHACHICKHYGHTLLPTCSWNSTLF